MNGGRRGNPSIGAQRGNPSIRACRARLRGKPFIASYGNTGCRVFKRGTVLSMGFYADIA